MNFDDFEQSTDGIADSSPAQSDLAAESNDTDLAVEQSFEDELKSFVTDLRSKKEKKSDSKPVDANQSAEEGEEDNVDAPPTEKQQKQPQPKEQPKHNKGAEQRIAQLVAREKEARSQAANLELSLKEMEKRIAFFVEENKYLASQLQLDPKDEQLRLYELQQRWQEEQRQLHETHQQEIQRREQELARQYEEQEFQSRVTERKREILESIQQAAKEYYDQDTDTYIVSPVEIAQAMERNQLSPTEAAKQIADRRLAIAAKKVKQPLAPLTAGSNTSLSTREPAKPAKWTGREANEEILADIMAQRARKRGM